jgi:lipopolysaccharide export system permease protein
LKILDRYIFREFLRYFFITCLSFVALYIIVDFFEKIRMFLSNDATAFQIASYFFYLVPVIISLVLPFALLLSTLLTYSSLSKFSEITAMKANGVSLYRILLPALSVATIVAVFLFFFSELVAPASIAKTEYIVKIDVQKQKHRGFFKQDEIWYRGRGAIYNFKLFDIHRNTLRGITIHYLNPDFSLKMRIDAKSAEWKNGQWVFHNLLTTSFDSNGSPALQWDDEKIVPLPEKPDDFKIIQKDAEKMGYFELRRYIKKIRAEGYDVSRYLVDLQGKLAFPFVCIILVVIGMSFSVRSERSGGLMQSVGIGILIGASYWIVHAFCMSLGRSGILPVLPAAWAANVLFSGAAGFLFYRVRT